MKSRRLQIKEALENLVQTQRAREFQWLAVQLAKMDWPELQATQEQRDGGEDATAFVVGSDGLRRRLACSLTGTLGKIRDDATRLQERHVELDTLVFMTAAPVDNLNVTNWRSAVQKDFRHDLHVIPQAEIIARLEQPQNAWLCREYLQLDFEDEPELKELEASARRIAAETLNSWRTEYRFDEIQPVELTLTRQLERSRKSSNAEPQSEPITLPRLVSSMRERKPAVLVGPPGAGKTITLIQLAELLLKNERAAIPLLVSLPGWSPATQDFGSWVAQQIVTHGLAAQGFSRLSAAGRIALLLNGWNEVPDHVASEAGNQLRAFSLNNPGTPIVISTRITRVDIPIPQKVMVKIEPLSAAQKRGIIERANLGDASNLLHALRTNLTLAEITETPFFLGAVIELARNGGQLPGNRFKILEALIHQMEERPEHSSALNGLPCLGFHRRYLCHIAGAMTKAGTVTFPSDGLLGAIAGCGKLLQDEGHLSLLSASTAIQDCLAKHHLLVLSPSFGGSYRFLHQQFQEWFAADWLRLGVLHLAQQDGSDRVFEFQREILNHARWQEPIAFLLEELANGGEEEQNAAAMLIRWAMPVDLVMAARLAGIAGIKVWPMVRDELAAALRDWYGRKSEHHCRCALAGMLATGMPDFQDIIWPLLEADDLGMRLLPHRLISPFPLDCLGLDWRSRFDKWDEKRRTEFLQHLSGFPSQAHLNLSAELATTDDSMEVKLASLRLLEDAGAFETLVRILKAPANAEFAKNAGARVLPRLPAQYLVSFGPELNILKQELGETQEMDRRFQILGALRAGHDPDWIRLAMAEMDRLFKIPGVSIEPPSHFLNPLLTKSAQANATPYLISCFRAMQEDSPESALDWLANRLVRGELWWEPFTDYLAQFPDSVLENLVEKALNPSLNVNDTRTHAVQLSRTGSPIVARVLINAYMDFSIQVEKEHTTPAFSRGDALKAGTGEIPLPVLVDAIIESAAKTADFAKLRDLVKLLMPNSPLESELRLQIPDLQKESVRSLVFRLVALCPPDHQDRPWLRASLAVLLGAVGQPQDSKVLEEWINEELQRGRNQDATCKDELKAWEAGGRRSRFPGSRSTTVYWNWYQGALIRLGCQEAIDVFLRLLGVPELFGQAAWGVAYLTRSEFPQPSTFGNRPDYTQVYRRRTSWEASGRILTQVARIRADAIFQVVERYLAEIDRPGSNMPLRELVSAATALAEFTDARAVPALLKLSSVKHADLWAIIHAFHGLVLRGVMISGKQFGDAFESVMAEHEKEPRGSGQDGWYIAVRCFAVLLFSDAPSIGVQRIRRLPPTRLHSWYVRDILDLLGACHEPEAARFLVELSTNTDITGHYFHELVTSLFKSGSEMAFDSLVGLFDRISSGEMPYTHDANILTKTLAQVTRADARIRTIIESRCKRAKTPPERNLLAQILNEIGDNAAAFSLCELIDDKAYITHDMEELVKNIALNRIPAGNPNYFQLEPRQASELRKHLLNIAATDAMRRKSALELLAAIVDWRIEYGAPANEPLHPDIEFLRQNSIPWPLIN